MSKSLLSVLLAACLTAACGTLPGDKKSELQQVAKDWSMTIRASQIIPVYPLTEDLQPGDVFLVQVPVDEQQKMYEKRGFLPLDNLVDRIQPSQFCAFYSLSFMYKTKDGAAVEDVKKNCLDLPGRWLAPGEKTAWQSAPGASFPTYTFSSRKGAGFNLALPVQGVPVGLSLLGGDAAQGSITISEARTYGLDTVSLYQDVVAWAKMPAHAEFLRDFAPSGKRLNYLRVVSRVYLTGNITVSLQSARSASGGLTAGLAKPVDVFAPSPGTDTTQVTADAYKKNLDTLNSSITDSIANLAKQGSGALPGGSLSVVAASANAVSLKETFPRPLVVGYLGFDVAIGDDGALGPPIPTHAVLTTDVKIIEQSVQSRITARHTDIDTIVARCTDPATKKLGDVRLQTTFKGTAFEDIPERFKDQDPDKLREELHRAKYNTSIATFRKNVDGLQ